jgi:hypothetical protein
MQLDHPREQATVLDFGGNRGNAQMTGRIKESNYWLVKRMRLECRMGRKWLHQEKCK